MFKIGDMAICICRSGWAEQKWYDGLPFRVEKEDLLHLNEGSFTEDFRLVKPKKIKPFGIVEFCKKYYK